LTLVELAPRAGASVTGRSGPLPDRCAIGARLEDADPVAHAVVVGLHGRPGIAPGRILAGPLRYPAAVCDIDGLSEPVQFLVLLFPEADAWALAIAGLGVVAAVLLRSRFALTLTTLGGISALGLVFDPQGSLYNVRLFHCGS